MQMNPDLTIGEIFKYANKITSKLDYDLNKRIF